MEIQDSQGFWIPNCGFRIPSNELQIPCQWNLDSRCQSLAGGRDSLSWITDLKFQDFWFQKQEFPGFRSRITLYGDMGQLKPFTGSFTRSHRKQNLSCIPQVSITLIPVMAFVQFAIDNVVIIPLILTRDLGRSDIVLTQSSFKDNNKLYGGAIKL